MSLAIQQQLEQLVESALRRTSIPGISVSLSLHGKRFDVARGVAEVGTGAALSVRSRFQVGCLMKLLMGMLIARLEDAGALNLDAPIATYLPLYAGLAGARDIRLRHLVSHTGGYEGLNVADAGVGYYYSTEKFLSFLRNAPQTYSPGTVFNYDHSQFVVLGQVIQQVAGTSVERLLALWLFDPLEMALGNTARDQCEPDVRVANHSLDAVSAQYRSIRSVPYCHFWSTSLPDLTIRPHDVATLGDLLVGSTALRGWSQGALERLYEPLIAVPHTSGGIAREQVPRAFGRGCARYRDGVFGHNGSARGQTIGLRFDPGARVAVAVAMNSWQPHLRDTLLDAICHAVSPARAGSPPDEPAPMWRFEELPGIYAGGLSGVEIEVSSSGADLICLARSRGTAGELRIVLGRARGDSLAPRTDAGHLSVGFFREPTCGSPCLMLGLNAYRKVA